LGAEVHYPCWGESQSVRPLAVAGAPGGRVAVTSVAGVACALGVRRGSGSAAFWALSPAPCLALLSDAPRKAWLEGTDGRAWSHEYPVTPRVRLSNTRGSGWTRIRRERTDTRVMGRSSRPCRVVRPTVLERLAFLIITASASRWLLRSAVGAGSRLWRDHGRGLLSRWRRDQAVAVASAASACSSRFSVPPPTRRTM